MSTGSNANFKVLGLSSDASWDEVKAAFRRLARLYHPDVAGPEGARKFAEITEAYMTLKETIAPGGSRAGGGASASSRAAEHAAETGEARESFFARFWRKLKALFTFAKKERVEAKAEEDAYEYDIPPARIRFIGGIISRAEADIYNLLSLRGEVKSRTRTDAILRRLRSRHPSVVMLALKGLAPRDANEEIKAAIVDHFKKQMPTSEVLESLLAFSSGTSMVWDFAKSLTEHSNDYSQNDALLILKWMKRHKVPKETYAAFLMHQSNAVVAATLNAWPPAQSLAEVPESLALLKKDDENILVPLLRLLKKEKLPIWALHTIAKIAAEHPTPAVRVWASAIVRDQNVS